jgi:ferredoxin-NADP reductase
MARELHTARLSRKDCISESAQCFHLEFAVEGMERFPFTPGQFVSLVKEDARGKLQTRAYSIASAPRANIFDLCVNRVEGGFFSNLLADMEEGATMQFHGAHGMFTLRQPLTDAILIATGTGIAPMRGFVEHLFPDHGPALSNGRQIWLVYGTRYPTELYYRDFFERKAAAHPDFRYVVTLSRPEESWSGERGYVQEHVEKIATEHQSTRTESVASAAEGQVGFNIHAYICGLNEMVSANRERLTALGWNRKQIIFERYD